LWSRHCGHALGSAPNVDDVSHRIFVVVEDPEGGATLAALASQTGYKTWESALTEAGPWSLCVDGSRGQVIVAARETLRATCATTGETGWRLAIGSRVAGSPTLDEDGICYVGTTDGYLHAVDDHSGVVLWGRRIGASVTCGPTLCRDVVLVGSRKHLIALERAHGGRVRWVAAVGGSLVALMVSSGHDLIISARKDGYVSLHDVTNGETVSRWHVAGGLSGAPSVGKRLIVVPSSDGRLSAFRWSLSLEISLR
jgi:outer membrane protein assembly factor BamB